MVKKLSNYFHSGGPDSNSLGSLDQPFSRPAKDSDDTSAPDGPDTVESSQLALQEEVMTLYSLWAGSLLRYARTFSLDLHMAQDALQETFLRYFLHRSEGRVFVNPKSWLFKVLRNFLLDYQKDAYQKSKADLERASLYPDPRQNQQVDFENREKFEQVTRPLSLRERECIRLRMEGFDYSEISLLMGIRKGTVGALIARALQKIEKER